MNQIVSFFTSTYVLFSFYSIIYYFIFISLLKFYASETERKKGTHSVVKVVVLLFSLFLGFFTEGLTYDLIYLRDYECPLRSYNCM